MPRTALANVAVDHTLPIRDLALAVARLVREPAGASMQPPHDVVIESRIAETGYSDEALTAATGRLSALSCPECGGPLWEDDARDLTRYRCRVGHAYGAQSLLSAQDESVESAVWAAIRMLDQRANVLAQMAAKDRDAQRTRMVAHHEQLAQESRQHAIALRALLLKAAG
jgi:two-component system chemotaxis response regulator CheB